MEAQGFGGEIRSGSRIAARVESWHLQPSVDDGTHVVHVKLEPVDEFWLTQPPFDVILFIGPARWRWRGVTSVGGSIPLPDVPEVS